MSLNPKSYYTNHAGIIQTGEEWEAVKVMFPNPDKLIESLIEVKRKKNYVQDIIWIEA